MEIIVERLEREFNLAVITTSPSVIYRVVKTDGTVEMIQNPTNLPPVHEISYIEEPMVKADIMIPKGVCGKHHELCQNGAERCSTWNISPRREFSFIMRCRSTKSYTISLML